MAISRKFLAVLNTLLLAGGCSGSGIGSKSENPSQYFGCYNYNNVPVLRISSDLAENLHKKENTRINGFLKIRSSNFVLTQNQIIFGNDGELKFTGLDTGFQYEFKRDVSPPTLLIYDEAGHEFDLVRSGNSCGLHSGPSSGSANRSD